MAYGNTTYTSANLLAYAAEKAVSKSWQNAYGVAHPLLGFILDRKGGFTSSGAVEGTKLIHPVMGKGPTTGWAGVVDASELTAISPVATVGATQVAYNWSHYQFAMWLAESEQEIGVNGSRGDVMEFKIAQMMEDFKRQLSDDLSGTQVDARDTVEGVPHALATNANTVGGIDQSDTSNNGWWAAQRNTSAGSFDFQLIDDIYDAIVAQGRGAPDLCLASWKSGVNIYGAMRSQLSNAQRLTTDGGKTAKYGYPTFEYLGMPVMQDNQLGLTVGATTGVIELLRTDAWITGGWTKPKQHQVQRLTGTVAQEFAYSFWMSIGCFDLATQGYISGITV